MTGQIKKCKDCVNYDETKVRQCICYNNECEPNEDATHCCEFANRVNRIKSAIEVLEKAEEWQRDMNFAYNQALEDFTSLLIDNLVDFGEDQNVIMAIDRGRIVRLKKQLVK